MSGIACCKAAEILEFHCSFAWDSDVAATVLHCDPRNAMALDCESYSRVAVDSEAHFGSHSRCQWQHIHIYTDTGHACMRNVNTKLIVTIAIQVQ